MAFTIIFHTSCFFAITVCGSNLVFIFVLLVLFVISNDWRLLPFRLVHTVGGDTTHLYLNLILLLKENVNNYNLYFIETAQNGPICQH